MYSDPTSPKSVGEALRFSPHFTEETMEAQHQQTFQEPPLDDGCLQWAWGYWPWVELAEICPPPDRVLGSHCDQRPPAEGWQAVQARPTSQGPFPSALLPMRDSTFTRPIYPPQGRMTTTLQIWKLRPRGKQLGLQ